MYVGNRDLSHPAVLVPPSSHRETGIEQYVGMLTSQVLRIQTKAQFEALRPQVLADLAALEARKLIKPQDKTIFEDW
jgi:hypothetical protein